MPEILQNAIKMQQSIEKLSDVKRTETLLYSDITGDIATKIATLVNERVDNKKRVEILNEIIRNKGFNVIPRTSNKTKIFGTIRKDDLEYGDNLNAAKALNNIGYDVYMLPRVLGSKSFDYILVKNSNIYAAELKTIYGKNSLDHRLEKASMQTDRIVLNIVGNVSSRYVADEIKDFYLNNPHIREIIVLRGGKPIYVRYGQVTQKDFVEHFMKRWAW